MDVNCLEMGSGCDQVVSGETLEELVDAVRSHMRFAHGRTDEDLAPEDIREMVRGAISQSSRPPVLRTPRPDI